MALTLPQADPGRFKPLAHDHFVLMALAAGRAKVPATQLKRKLGKYLSGGEVEAAVETLVSFGQVRSDGDGRLAPSGERGTALLGKDRDAGWDLLQKRRLPLLALGLDPDSADVRRRFNTTDSLRSGAISLSYGLASEPSSKVSEVRNELTWRVLRAGLRDLIGQGPFPPLAKPDPIQTTVLLALAGLETGRINVAFALLAAKAIGSRKSDADSFRIGLIQRGLSLAAAEPQGKSPGTPADDPLRSFAERVRNIARGLSTPPFRDRVAIAQVYDAYGRQHSDAGSLEAFKARLVEAAKAGSVTLTTLDLPEMLAREARTRSETLWGSSRVHFVSQD